tara:strand:+ start:2873 stop:3379 length:507 start_codon:yes stop_codon:yes gene_type:complete
MCNKKSVYLRCSNRGDAVTALVANQSFSVNLPANLRSRRACFISVVEGTIAITTSVGINLMKAEIGVLSNIPMYGFNTETPANSNNFMSENNKVLFSVDLNSLAEQDGTANNVSLPMINPRTFYCGGLPEKIEFERYSVAPAAASTIEAFIHDNYISFTLKIEFEDEE